MNVASVMLVATMWKVALSPANAVKPESVATSHGELASVPMTNNAASIKTNIHRDWTDLIFVFF
jgi:hypothetical protein